MGIIEVEATMILQSLVESTVHFAGLTICNLLLQPHAIISPYVHRRESKRKRYKMKDEGNKV